MNQKTKQKITTIAQSCLRRLQFLDEMILLLLYQKHCPFCDERLESAMITGNKSELCDHCLVLIKPISDPFCMKCGKPLEEEAKEYCYDCQKKRHSFVQTRAFCLYQKEVRESMYRLKYGNRRDYGITFANLWYEQNKYWLKGANIQLIVPVPLSKKRRKKRGYNQAAIIGKRLAQLSGIPMDERAVVRIKDTLPQKDLSDEERKNNVKKAFISREYIVKSKNVLLVDDIYTTGATIDAAATSLLECGVRQVYGATISIGRGF